MKRNLQSGQITHAAVVIIMTTSLLSKTLYIFTKNDAWLAVIAALCLSSVVYLMYMALTQRFQGLDLFDINKTVFGNVTGKVISVLYVYFFFTIAAFNVNLMGSFVQGIVLPSTPTLFVMSFFVIVCMWAARKGPQNLLQYSFLFSIVSIAVIVINALLLYKNYHLEYFFPMLTLPVQNYLAGLHAISIVPLCDPIVFMMFISAMKRPEEFGKALFKGLLLGAAVLFLIVVRDIAVLGPTSAVVNFPSYTIIRLIDVGDVFTRVDIIYISVLISLMFYKVTVFFCAALSGMQRLFGFESYKFMVFILGALLLIYASTVFPEANEHSEWLVSGAASFHNTLFVVLLPLLTLIVAVMRGFYKKPETAVQ